MSLTNEAGNDNPARTSSITSAGAEVVEGSVLGAE